MLTTKVYLLFFILLFNFAKVYAYGCFPIIKYIIIVSNALDLAPFLPYDNQINELFNDSLTDKADSAPIRYRSILCDRNQHGTFSSRHHIYKHVSSFDYNTLIPLHIWNELEPYFLPVNHPIKESLDYLFHNKRITLSQESFKEAGFGKAKIRKPTNVVVGKNPFFKGYIFKVYFDTQPTLCEWDNWIKRIKGAQAIRACIHRHAIQHLVVPRKWIYPLPEEPSPPITDSFNRKNFILIAEDMHILDQANNVKAFKTEMTHQLLEELFLVLNEVGLFDSVYPSNIPFTKNGKIAFVDTEHHDSHAVVPYHKLSHFLSEEMQAYWHQLTYILKD